MIGFDDRETSALPPVYIYMNDMRRNGTAVDEFLFSAFQESSAPERLRMLRLKDVLQKVGLKRATVYNKIRDGTFPPPVKVSDKTALWPEHEVDLVLKAWIVGLTEEEMRALVSSIVAERQNLKKFLPLSLNAA